MLALTLRLPWSPAYTGPEEEASLEFLLTDSEAVCGRRARLEREVQGAFLRFMACLRATGTSCAHSPRPPLRGRAMSTTSSSCKVEATCPCLGKVS